MAGKPAENTSKRKIVWTILIVIFAVVAAVCVVQLAIIFWPTLHRQIVEDPFGEVSAPVSSAEPVVELVDNPIDFAALQAQNPDIVGWIKVPGTVIDYPVLQSGQDKEEWFYLDHDENGNARRSGSIFIEKANDASFHDDNTVLAGHYMANGTMFADLHQFRKEAFFNEHDTIYIYTPGHILTYRIYSAFVYDNRHVLNSFYTRGIGTDEEKHQRFIDVTLDPPSMARHVREGVEVTAADRIISLFTCTMKEEERYYVEGVLINDQLTH